MMSLESDFVFPEPLQNWEEEKTQINLSLAQQRRRRQVRGGLRGGGLSSALPPPSDAKMLQTEAGGEQECGTPGYGAQWGWRSHPQPN